MRSPRDERAPSGRSGVGQAIGDAAVFPARVAANALRSSLETAAEDVLAAPEIARLLDRALSGPLPEELVHSLVRHRVLERAVEELAASGELDRMLEQMLESPRAVEFVNRALASEEMASALQRILAGPEVRSALASHSAGLVEQVADGLRRWTRRLDRRLEVTPALDVYAGVASRGIGLVVDAAVVAAVTLAIGAGAGLVVLLVGGLHPHWLGGLLAGLLNVVVAGTYFTLFWSTAGQTLGMRLMRVRVITDRPDSRLSVGRALLRTFGLALAIIPCFLGFVPTLFDSRRRALQDFLAQTVVVVDDEPPPG